MTEIETFVADEVQEDEGKMETEIGEKQKMEEDRTNPDPIQDNEVQEDEGKMETEIGEKQKMEED